MARSDLGKFMVQAGVSLMFLPVIFLGLMLIIGFLSTITVTTTMLIVFGVLVYYAIAIFLIVYGKHTQE